MIDNVPVIPRTPPVRRNLLAAQAMPVGPVIVNVPPPEADIVFENTPRTSLEDFIILAEAAEEDTENHPIPSAAFTPRGASLSRYATPPAGTISR